MVTLWTTPWTALWFLPFVLPITLWVAWSDMKFMKIPNMAVLALMLVFAVIGPIALPLDVWAWRWVQAFLVLVVTFLLNAAGVMGAGDSKFIAAMALFVPSQDLRFMAAIYAAASLGALASHRLGRRITPLRTATPDWASWTTNKFPMGLALSGMLTFYLLAALWLGQAH